jgi:3-oxoacyl-ACP reductase-like protein
MSIFGKIVSTIFGHASAAPAPTASAPGAPAAPAAPTAPGSAPAAGAAAAVDVAAVLNKLAAGNKEKLDWQKSIVDLMKLLNLDSSLTARKELADELHYSGDKNDSASMNIWLHKQVMQKLAENGGKVPEALRK